MDKLPDVGPDAAAHIYEFQRLLSQTGFGNDALIAKMPVDTWLGKHILGYTRVSSNLLFVNLNGSAPKPSNSLFPPSSYILVELPSVLR